MNTGLQNESGSDDRRDASDDDDDDDDDEDEDDAVYYTQRRSDTDSYADSDQSSTGESEGDVPDGEAAGVRHQTQMPHASYEQRWARLRQYYSDAYLELFKRTFDDDQDAADLLITQLGAVTWTPDEKHSLYQVLSKKGRHDLPAMAAGVGTKTELEVRDYLSFLRQQEADRHLFESRLHAISATDIPAALEIGEECEALLERSADALAAFQDQYDHSLGMQQTNHPWIIDLHVARSFDQRAEEVEEDRESTSPVANEEIAITNLFKLSNWLTLSAQLFMNQGKADAETNWRSLVTKEEGPSMTYRYVCDMQDLVVSFLRRLMQTALFLTMSRVRASAEKTHGARPCVRKDDVITALDVLGIDSDPHKFWIKMARRNRLQVVTYSHDKRSSTARKISYKNVEQILSIRLPRGRRRSFSLFGDDSVSNSEREPLSDNETQMSVHELSTPESHSISSAPSPSSRSEPSEYSSESVKNDDVEDAESKTFFEDNHSPPRQKKAQRDLDFEQDLYIEEYDKAASRDEEFYLRQLLGQEVGVNDEQKMKLGDRPAVRRKERDELQDWNIAYAAEWEHFGTLLPKEKFEEMDQRRKRRKVDAEGLESMAQVESEILMDSSEEESSESI